MKRKYSLLISGAFALVMAAVIGLSGQLNLSADRSEKSDTQKQFSFDVLPHQYTGDAANTGKSLYGCRAGNLLL